MRQEKLRFRQLSQGRTAFSSHYTLAPPFFSEDLGEVLATSVWFLLVGACDAERAAGPQESKAVFWSLQHSNQQGVHSCAKNSLAGDAAHSCPRSIGVGGDPYVCMCTNLCLCAHTFLHRYVHMCTCIVSTQVCVQLTFGQQGFELYRPTYTWIFSVITGSVFSLPYNFLHNIFLWKTLS